MITLLLTFLAVSFTPIFIALLSRKFTPHSPNIILHFFPYHTLAKLFVEPLPAHFFVICAQLRKGAPAGAIFQKAYPHLKDAIWVLYGNSPIRRIMEQARIIANRDRISYSQEILSLLCSFQLSCPTDFAEFVKEYPALQVELEKLSMHEKVMLSERFLRSQ